MKHEELTQAYKNAVINWSNKNGYYLSFHIVDILRSILMHRDQVVTYAPGSFVRAFINNDLRGAFGSADPEVSANMRTLVLGYHNIDTYVIKQAYLLTQKEELAHVE